MSKIPELLDEQIESKILELDDCADREEVKLTIEELTKLHALRQEEAKIRQKDSELEMEDKKKYERMIDRIVSTATTVGLAIGGWIVYDKWQCRGLIFEKENIVSSPWIKNLMSNMTKVIHK